jgi:hypothetical protein
VTVTREMVKSEIDKVQEEYLGVLLRIVNALEPAAGREARKTEDQRSWEEFIAETYGSFAGDPIERGDQGNYEVRLPFE